MPPAQSWPAARPRVDLERLRLEHPIADVVASCGIELRRVGSTHVGRCPFHVDGGRPNLTVFPGSDRFVCFRCGARGDQIEFLRQIGGFTFLQAIARLGASAPRPRLVTRLSGTHIRDRRRARARVRSGAELDVLDAAAELYHNRLLLDQDALTYLIGRGVQPNIIEEAKLGLCAAGELVPYLHWRRLPLWAAHRCGLLTRAGTERLVGRVVIPEVRSARTVWMIGRALESAPDKPKYLGLPGSKPLLGWDLASHDTRAVCLVEGPFDWLVLRGFDIPALALCGTGVSADMLEQLEQWQRIYAAFDSDAAGADATARLVRALGPRVSPVSLPPPLKDPAELALRPDGDTLVRAALAAATAPAPPWP